MKGWATYHHRPDVVKAVRVGDASWRDIAEWCRGTVIRDGRRNSFIYFNGSKAYPGDYIFKTADGFFGVYGAKTFEAKYVAYPKATDDSLGAPND